MGPAAYRHYLYQREALCCSESVPGPVRRQPAVNDGPESNALFEQLPLDGKRTRLL